AVLAVPTRAMKCDIKIPFSSLSLFPGNLDLVISEEGTPGTTAKHERLHERSFCLDGVHQIVRGPCLKHLCQGDGAKRWMLCRPFQVVIFHMLEQDQAFLPLSRERLRK